MNYDWLEDPKVISLGQLEQHCFFASEPEHIQSLNGNWLFSTIDQISSPFSDYFKQSDFHLLELSSLHSIGKFNSSSQGISKQKVNTVYKKIFDCKLETEDKKIILSVENANSFSAFFLNEKFLGYQRLGGLNPEFDITNVVKPLGNELTIQVINKKSNAIHVGNAFLEKIMIYTLPTQHIKDYQISTSWSENNGAAFELTVDVDINSQVEVALYDDNQAIIVKDCHQTLTVKNLFLEPWSTENPKLYFLEIRVFDKEENLLQKCSQFIGFRSVEIKNGILHFNGKYLTIKGINRTTNYKNPNLSNEEDNMLIDIRMMKSANINAVSNLEGPHHKRWYELCDKYGILVIDHIFYDKKHHILSDDLETLHRQNVEKLYHQSKNHTCVIGWNLGNETLSTFNFSAAYQWIKTKADGRLVFFTQDEIEGNSEVTTLVNPSIDLIQSLGKNESKKPILFAQYSSAGGNHFGGFKNIWKEIKKHDSIQGGFLNQLVDQSHKNDHGEWDYDALNHLNGILLPDRTPHPAYFEIQKVFQVMSFKIDRDENLIVFRNHNYFEPIVGVIEIRIWEASRQLFFQRRNFELPEQSSELITYEIENYSFSDSVFLDVRAFLNNGELVGEDQFILFKKKTAIPNATKRLDFPFAITPNLSRSALWNHSTGKVYQEKLKTIHPELSEEYEGSILKVKMSCTSNIPLMRFGIKLYLPKLYSQVSYLGRGPIENYQDRKSAALWGQYYTTPEKMIPSYLVPQESAYRSENEELIITDLHGNGFKFTSPESFGFSYLPFELPRQSFTQDLESPIHSKDTNDYVLCIDSYMVGIGDLKSSQETEQNSTYEFNLYISAV